MKVFQFPDLEPRIKIEAVIGGEWDFFSMLPIGHYGFRYTIEILDGQRPQRYVISRGPQCSLKNDVF